MIINELNQKIPVDFSQENNIFKTQDSGEERISSSGKTGSVLADEIRKIISTTVENNQGIGGRNIGKDGKESARKADRQEENLRILKNSLSSTVAGELKGEEKSLQDMSVDELAQAVIRIRKQNLEKQEFSEERAVNKDKEEEEALMAAVKSKETSDIAITQWLKAVDLPMSEELAGQIMLAASMAVESQGVTDSQKIFMIQSEGPLTIRKLYESGHAGEAGQQSGNEDLAKAFEDVKPQVEKLLENMGFAAAAEGGSMPADAAVAEGSSMSIDTAASEASEGQAMDYARFLFENQLPITEENISKLFSMDEIAGMGAGEILEEIIYQVSLGKLPEQTDLSLTHYQAAKAAGQFKNDIDSVIDNTASMEQEYSRVTARRQLEEIRIKMTVESGYRLMKQGISLDIPKMQQIVEGLKNLEKELYEGILKEAGAEEDSTSVDLLKSTMDAIDYLKDSPADVLGASLSVRFSMTMRSLSADSKKLMADGHYAAKQYETLGTAPRADLGDSITKAFKNIPQILNSLDMDLTEENQRAVRILGRCGMEITKESIDSMKAYDSQVNHLINHLHPAIAARMIKEGDNPLDTPIYELNQKIDSMREEMGITKEEKYSSYLWKLEHTEGISENERSGYIGLYRLLYQIQSEDGAAVGNVVESGKDMTLSNLLTAVRTRKAGEFEQAVTPDFQGLLSAGYETDSITAQISRGFSGGKGENAGQGRYDNAASMPHAAERDSITGNATGNKAENAAGNNAVNWTASEEMIEYFTQMVDEMLSLMEPAKIAKLLSEGNASQGGDAGQKGFMELPLDSLYEKITAGGQFSAGGNLSSETDVKINNSAVNNGTDTQSEEAEELSLYKNVMENSGEEIRFLNSLNQPVTLANLYAAGFLKNGSTRFLKNVLKQADSSDKSAADINESGKNDNINEGSINDNINEAGMDGGSVNEGGGVSKKWKESAENVLEKMTDGDSLNEALEEFIDNTKNVLSENMFSETITAAGLREIRGMGMITDFISGLKREQRYEIPVLTDKGITGVSLTVLSGRKEGGKVQIVMEDILKNEIKDGLDNGKIEAEFSLNRGRVSGYILSSERETEDILENGRQVIENALMENGVEIGQIQISSGGLLSSAFVEQGKEETGALYRLAKSYIKAVFSLG